MHPASQVVMVWTVAIDALAAGAVLAIWYLWFAHYNRKRASEVLRWIHAASTGHGQLGRVHWSSPSRFHVGVWLSSYSFQHAWITVELLPRELPLNWLVSWSRHKQETATFDADLDCAPNFNLEVHNHRWLGPPKTKISASSRDQWNLLRPGPFVLTTRTDWHKDLTNMMHALVASRDSDFLKVCFRRKSPHFSATVPLQSLAPNSQSAAALFDVLRELATGASASRF
jgi:hypothetical protein